MDGDEWLPPIAPVLAGWISVAAAPNRRASVLPWPAGVDHLLLSCARRLGRRRRIEGMLVVGDHRHQRAEIN